MLAPPAAPPADPPTRRRSVLRDAAFLRLWCGATASGLATWAMPFVLGLAVLDRSLTPAGLGVVLAARTVGFLAAVPLGGLLADRYSRRRTVLWSSAAAAAATPVVAVGLGWSVPLMAGAAVVVGAGQGACRPAYQALTAEVVDAPQRQQANAAMSLAVRVSTLVAPGAAAVLATLLSVSGLLWVTAACWLASALAPPRGATPGGATVDGATVDGTTVDGAARAGEAPGAARRAWLVAEFAEGVREARRHPWFVAGLAALTAVITTGYSATGVLLPLVSRDRYGGEAVLVAALTAYTAGALLGAVLVARWRPANPGWMALAGLAGYGFAPLGLLLPVPAAAVAGAYVLAGVGIELFNVYWFTSIQREVEPSRLARVSSLDFLLSYGLAPVGLALIAPARDAVGDSWVLGACALLCFLAPALAACAPTARHFGRERPAD